MTHAVVIGGGPAGAALALPFARAGREGVLVEREADPVDKVSGEFLSREAGLYLASLGLDLPAHGAVPIDAVPIDAVPIDAVPIDAVPIDAVPIDAVRLCVREHHVSDAALARTMLWGHP